jgi:hypothetical protein
MDRDASETNPGAMHDGSQALLKGPELLGDRGLKLKRELQLGGALDHSVRSSCQSMAKSFADAFLFRRTKSAKPEPKRTKSKAPSRRKNTNVIDFALLLARTRRSPAPAKPMQHEKIVSADLLTFPGGGRYDGVPVSNGNSSTLAPLAGAPGCDADVVGHLIEGVPAVKEVPDRAHGTTYTQDNLSRQRVTSRPVTGLSSTGTLRPMGKATTPTQFKRDFCLRLRSFRVAAGYQEAADFAKALGLLPNTYSKYENRSLLPHYLIPRVCELLDIEVTELYLGRAVKRKIG